MDVIIAGCGPAGATAGALLAERGYCVSVIEREVFPRFQIGESLLPYNGAIFDRLGIRAELDSDSYVAKHGAEFKTADGERSTKFSFARYLPQHLHKAWHVRRAEFDHLLMRKAREKGADVREGWTVTGLEKSARGYSVKMRNREGNSESVSGRFFIDASGSGMLSRALGVSRREDPDLRKVAIFAHFKGALPPGEETESGNIVISMLRDGWSWMIPVSDQLTSVGIVVDGEALKSSGRAPEEILMTTIESTPALAERLRTANREGSVLVRKDFSFTVDRVWGDNFALIGDAAGFVDPIFSTGVLIAMRSAELVADGVEEILEKGSTRKLRDYQRLMGRVLGRYRRLIRGFYKREFVEVFLDPHEKFGLGEAIIRLLAGNAFEKESGRWKMELFYGLVRLQRLTGVIARPVPWDTLPSVFEPRGTEEIVGRRTIETSVEGASDRAPQLRGYGSG